MVDETLGFGYAKSQDYRERDASNYCGKNTQ